MIYFIECTGSKMIKIGHSKNPIKRLKDLSSANAFPLVLLGVLNGDVKTEQQIHYKLIKSSFNREWFKPTADVAAFIEMLTPIHVPEGRQKNKSKKTAATPKKKSGCSEFAAAAGISKGYACDIMQGNRRPSPALACRIYRTTGQRFGPIVGLSEIEIEDVERSISLLTRDKKPSTDSERRLSHSVRQPAANAANESPF